MFVSVLGGVLASLRLDHITDVWQFIYALKVKLISQDIVCLNEIFTLIKRRWCKNI